MSQPMKPSRTDQAGFTLLETIIALAIMVVTLASILSVESNSITTSARARQMNVVAMLARNKMAEVENSVEGKVFDEVKKEDGGAFEAPFQDYRWSLAIKEVKLPSLNFSAAGGGEEKEGGAQPVSDVVALLTRLVTKYLSKSLREMTVTILWTGKSGKEQSFAVSTYWVDLNRDFELSE